MSKRNSESRVEGISEFSSADYLNDNEKFERLLEKIDELIESRKPRSLQARLNGLWNSICSMVKVFTTPVQSVAKKVTGFAVENVKLIKSGAEANKINAEAERTRATIPAEVESINQDNLSKEIANTGNHIKNLQAFAQFVDYCNEKGIDYKQFTDGEGIRNILVTKTIEQDPDKE